MKDIFNSIFTLILVYGYPAVAVSVFVTSAGVPLPGVTIVLVAGSLAAAGNHNFVTLFLLVTVCSMAGDLADYFLGKKIGHKVIEKFFKPSKLASTSLTKAEQYFSKWSGLSIFVSRWLPPSAPAISFLAGITGYPFYLFLIFDMLGELVSSIIFLGLGYTFSVNWPYIWNYLNSTAGIGVGAIVGISLVVIGIRGILRKRTRST